METENNNQTSPKVLAIELSAKIDGNNKAIELLTNTGGMQSVIDDLTTANDGYKVKLISIESSVMFESACSKLESSIKDNLDLYSNHLALLCNESYNKDSIQYVVTINYNGVSARHATNTTRKARKAGKTKVIVNGVEYPSGNKALLDLISQGIEIIVSKEAVKWTKVPSGANAFRIMNSNKIKYTEVNNESSVETSEAIESNDDKKDFIAVTSDAIESNSQTTESKKDSPKKPKKAQK